MKKPANGFEIILPLRSSLRETREVRNESVLLRSVAPAGESRALTRTTRPLWTVLMTAWLALSYLFTLQASAHGGSGTNAGDMAAANNGKAVAWSEVGAKAGADYKGEGLAVTATESGARLRCVFQRLEGEATAEGLWLTSTVTNAASERFSVKATEVGRRGAYAPLSSEECEWNLRLAGEGSVSVGGQTVRFTRAGLTEEYSVSMDGVRQDLIVEQAPPGQGAGELVVRLAVMGAQVEAAVYGAQLVLENSGRRIAYSRLRVTDATGKALAARIEAGPAGEDSGGFGPWSGNEAAPEDVAWASCPSPHGQDARATKVELAVVVEDADAEYPVRIDPTFSDANWVSMGGIPGAQGFVEAAVADRSGNLYIGGYFTGVGGCYAHNIAQWNGSSWWALGSGVNNVAYALALSGSTLYAGGLFTTAGGVSANYIAQWDGSSWSALGSGMDGPVSALAVSGSTLYAGGDFTTAGGVPANYIAQWNGSSWSALGSGMNGYGVYALAVSGSTLYAGGGFTTAGGVSASYIAQWNGSSWSAVGSGISGAGANSNGPYVGALAVSGSTLYAGGDFRTAGGVSASYIAQWNGSSWWAVGSGISGAGANGNGPYVGALAVSGSTLYAGGDFTAAGGVPANYIAQWDGSSWSALGSGMNSQVDALAVSGSTLYAGGDFTAAGRVPANYIAQWDGSSWSALESGINSAVWALAASGSTLYAGGTFTTAGGVSANYIAQWNGSSWSALGSGMNGPVSALAVSGSTLYAGGYFTRAGDDTNANYIAQWNGTSWSGLGSGMGGAVPYPVVGALAVSGSALYAGGWFTTAGGVPANFVAQWNGSSWSALASGMSYGVGALAVSGSTLYAGGDFTAAGGALAYFIAQWNGSSWSALGSGMDNPVSALAVSGGTLYAGGLFGTAGGASANYIAQWNGSNWSALGSGMNGLVFALAVSGSTLYAGGGFTTAGTNVSAYAAMANLAGAPVSPVIITTNAAFGFTNGAFGFDVSGPSGASVVIEGSADLQTWIPLQTNGLGGAGLLYFSDPQAATNSTRFYRALLP